MRISELNPKPSFGEPLEIPEALMGSVRRHQANLATLVATLQAAGYDDDMVAGSIRTLIDSYATELTAAIRGMMKGAPHE